MNTESIEQTVLQLPVQQRAELARKLLQSLDALVHTSQRFSLRSQ